MNNTTDIAQLVKRQENYLHAVTSLLTRVGFMIEDVEAAGIDPATIPQYEVIAEMYKLANDKLEAIAKL